MVRITKVYTKKGDKGETALAAGKKISKDSAEIDAIGNLDELNAFLGFAAAALLPIPELDKLHKKITRIQNELFDLGSGLAVAPTDRRSNTPIITELDVERLETEINAMNTDLPYLKSFILPNGGECASRLHLARTVCRRAERSLVICKGEEPMLLTEIKYLNRLSDWLFVAARFTAHKLKVTEQLWEAGRRDY